MPDEEFKRYGAKLTALADWLQAEGCPMTYHHHMGTVVETEREIDLLMANTGPAVGLLVDIGHLTFAGGDVLATTRRHGQPHQPRPLQGHPRRRAAPASRPSAGRSSRA